MSVRCDPLPFLATRIRVNLQLSGSHYLYYFTVGSLSLSTSRASESRELIVPANELEYNGGRGGRLGERGVHLIPLIPAKFSGDPSRCYF